MRTYLPTYRLLASFAAAAAAGCAGGSAVTGFSDGGGTGGDGGAGRDGTTGDSHVMLPGEGGFGQDTGGSGTGSGSGSDAGSGTDATGRDSGMMQTCTVSSDCTAPNMCAGNNGLACLGGFCVATNMPATCDDGVPCTVDSCDAMTNMCVHTPTNSACPMDEFCDPTMNCVMMLSCTPGDSVCDRLDTTVCAGLWSCSASTGYCMHNPAPCPSRPNATVTCSSTPLDGGVVADAGSKVDGGDITADCHWVCNAGYTDTNGDLNVPIGQPSMGCNCMVSNPVDLPDYPGFTDTNCDGIDGTVAAAIFVDTLSGNDNNPGTMAKPMATITAGITLAATQSPPAGFPGLHKDVYVSLGTYNERISMVNGVSLYGGYNAATGWSRGLANITKIQSPQHVGIDAQQLNAAFNIQFVTVTSTIITGTVSNGGGESSYGIRIVSCTAGATVEGCTITPSVGTNAPSPAPNGTNGGNAGNGGNSMPITTGPLAGGFSGGVQGSSPCGAIGGIGGVSVYGIAAGTPGGAGTFAGGGTAGPSGGGGTKGKCDTTSASNGGNGAPPGANGGPGANGTNASIGSAIGTIDANGNYLPAAGPPGASAGLNGGGGGGGGAGGGTQTGGSFPDEADCDSVWSGGGGGGGGGGCGGAVGQGGAGGGGSIALLILSTSVITSGNTYNPAAGGNGGNGGNGGSGGSGGSFGLPTDGTTTGDDDNSGGNGAQGSAGGNGGNGGGGAGGSGGPSACIVYQGASPASTGDICNSTTGGAPGAGGGGAGGGTAATGPTGATGDLMCQ